MFVSIIVCALIITLFIPQTQQLVWVQFITLRFFYIRELDNYITTRYLSTEDTLTDIGNKHLKRHKLKKLVDCICQFDENDFLNNDVSVTDE